MTRRREGRQDDRWQVFLAFWLFAGVALLTIGIATFVAVRHSHRIGGFLAALGVGCLAIANLVRLGRRGSP